MLPQFHAKDYTYYLCIGYQRQKKNQQKTIQTEARSNDIIL